MLAAGLGTTAVLLAAGAAAMVAGVPPRRPANALASAPLPLPPPSAPTSTRWWRGGGGWRGACGCSGRRCGGSAFFVFCRVVFGLALLHSNRERDIGCVVVCHDLSQTGVNLRPPRAAVMPFDE